MNVYIRQDINLLCPIPDVADVAFNRAILPDMDGPPPKAACECCTVLMHRRNIVQNNRRLLLELSARVMNKTVNAAEVE